MCDVNKNIKNNEKYIKSEKQERECQIGVNEGNPFGYAAWNLQKCLLFTKKGSLGHQKASNSDLM